MKTELLWVGVEIWDPNNAFPIHPETLHRNKGKATRLVRTPGKRATVSQKKTACAGKSEKVRSIGPSYGPLGHSAGF